MNIYAIHEIKNFSYEYNVAICSSKKIAEKHIKKLLKDYDEWRKSIQKEFNEAYPNNDYICSYNPPKYWIEKLKVITK
jgi:hypothetical protein